MYLPYKPCGWGTPGEWACVVVSGPCWCGYVPCTSFVKPGQFELCSVEGSSKLGVPCIHGPMPQGTRVHLAVMVPNSKGTISHPQLIAEEQHLPLNLRGMTSFHVPLNFHEAGEQMVHLVLAGLAPPSLFFNLKRPCDLWSERGFLPCALFFSMDYRSQCQVLLEKRALSCLTQPTPRFPGSHMLMLCVADRQPEKCMYLVQSFRDSG